MNPNLKIIRFAVPTFKVFSEKEEMSPYWTFFSAAPIFWQLVCMSGEREDERVPGHEFTHRTRPVSGETGAGVDVTGSTPVHPHVTLLQREDLESWPGWLMCLVENLRSNFKSTPCHM